MMSTAIAERPAIPADELDLIRKTVANGATDAELKLFLFDCQRRGVHPLDKLLHFTKRGGRYTPVTSIDFMRSQAASTGEMAGSDDPVFHPKPTGADPEKFLPPSAATVTVYRMTQGQRFAYTATARWAEYCPDNAPMWRRMPHTMLGKCAEALALRKAFPQQLQGLYAREEMDQAENAAPAEPARLQVKSDAVDAAIVNTENGEQLPAAPEGYHYVTGYKYAAPWHEADLLRWDDKGGALRVSTKLKIGELLAQASNQNIPAKCDVTPKRGSVGQAYLNKIELWKSLEEMTQGAAITSGEIPF